MRWRQKLPDWLMPRLSRQGLILVDSMDVEPSKVAGHCAKRLAVAVCEEGGPEGRPIKIDDCEKHNL